MVPRSTAAMRYAEFKHAIERELRRHPEGLTWSQLKSRLRLPYARPCGTWVRNLESDIGLARIKGETRAHVWTLDR